MKVTFQKMILMITIVIVSTFPLFGQMGMPGGYGYHQHRVDRNLVFPHLALGEGYTLTVVLMNPGVTDALSGRLSFYKQDGTALPVSIEGQMVTYRDITLPPSGTVYLSAGPAGPGLVSGWAIFELVDDGSGNWGGHHGSGGAMDHSNYDHVFGTLIYEFAPGDATQTQVGLLGSRYEMGYFMGFSLPVSVGTTVNTGIALVNTGTLTQNVALRLISSAGALTSETTLVLPPGGQNAFYVSDAFPGVDFTQFRGSVEVRNQYEGIVALGLLQIDGILTSIPVVHIPDSMPGWGSGGPHM